MAGPVARRAFRLPPYSGTAVASLRLAVVLAFALGLGGCAVSGPLGSMFSKQSKDDARAYASEDVTGSVGTPPASPVSASTAKVRSRSWWLRQTWCSAARVRI